MEKMKAECMNSFEFNFIGKWVMSCSSCRSFLGKSYLNHEEQLNPQLKENSWERFVQVIRFFFLTSILVG